MDYIAFTDDDLGMVTFSLHEVFRQLIDQRKELYGRVKLAEILGCTAQNVDYMAAGERKKKDGSLQKNYVGLEYLERLAAYEPGGVTRLMTEVATITARIETEAAIDATNAARAPEAEPPKPSHSR